MDHLTSWKRADGVITGVFRSGTSPFVSGDVRYTFAGAWIVGGEGQISITTPMLPKRAFNGTTMLESTCDVGDPATLTVSPTGVMRLYVGDNETWAVTDCE